MLEVLGLDQGAEDVYRALLAGRAGRVNDLCHLLGLDEGPVRAALAELATLSLVRHSADVADGWRAIDPQTGLQALLAQQNAELERRRARIAASQADIAALLAERTEPRLTAGPGGTRRLVGVDAVITRLEQLSETARTEVLGITPGSAQSPAALTAARRNDSRLFDRGVAVREIVQDACRHDPATAAHARWLTEAGGQVRTAPTLPHRMIVIDAQTALVPIDTANTRAGALELTNPGIVGTLVALFGQVWETATPLGASAAPDRYGLTGREREVLRLLAAGMTDETVATRLAISDRTVRRIMNDLCERLNAASRFEAGIKAAQAGWLDDPG